MQYPFSMLGRIIQIHRYKVEYSEELPSRDDTGQPITKSRTQYCNTQERAQALAEATDGTITQLDSAAYEWLDGIEVADVPDTYAEAVKLYEMGGDGWLAKAKEEKQAENNAALAEYLHGHPITWTDGKQYGVGQQDQQEIALNLTQYQLSIAAGLPAKLEWHAVHEECREFTPEELSGLAMAISAYVYPLVRKNQAYKTAIYGATTAAELKEVVLTYEEAV